MFLESMIAHCNYEKIYKKLNKALQKYLKQEGKRFNSLTIRNKPLQNISIDDIDSKQSSKSSFFVTQIFQPTYNTIS